MTVEMHIREMTDAEQKDTDEMLERLNQGHFDISHSQIYATDEVWGELEKAAKA